MLLPDLKTYRKQLIQEGATYPLPVVTTGTRGLLKSLPPVPTGKTGWPWDEETDAAVYACKTDWPKITIVTPSYNQSDFLEQTIRAVLLQNYPNLEYVVIDGGSTDSSNAILEKYSPWLSYWRSQKDNGQSHAINLGFSLGSGEYYAWINSDDYYLKGVFQLVAGAFIKQHADFVYGYAYNYKVSTGQFELVTVPPLLDYFIKIPTLAQPSCFWRAAINQPVWEEMHCALDYELWLRLVKGKKRYRLTQPLSVANVHGQAKTSDENMKARWQQDHEKMWSADGHGPVPEWKRVVFFNRIRLKIYKLLKVI